MLDHPPLRELLGYAGIFARFPPAVRRFVAQPLEPALAHALVREQMAAREASFLRLVRESVYGHPASPYRALLELAGCELGDVEGLVAAEGIEGTLRRLREADVYVSFEEFKGRRPIVRGSHTIPVAPADFDNPRAKRDLSLTTGGSTGQANLVYQDLDHVAALAVHELVGLEAHGVLDAPTIHWSHILPGSGIRFVLQRVRHGRRTQTWFTPLGWRDTSAWQKYGAATRYMLWWMRRFGVRVDDPVVVRPHDAIVVAWAVREALDREGRCLLYSSVSQAVRVAAAATEAGLDLDGATMRLASEPLTPARRRLIEESGARALAGYGSIETGVIAIGCPHGRQADDVHLLRDAFAVIDHPVPVPRSDAVVSAFNLTGLRAAAPKVMLNYQIDDHGSLETRTCGCDLERFGYDVHLHSIRSYTKLVGEGGTLVGEDLLQLIEVALPRRFGGTPLDYQLQEEYDASGLTRLVVVVAPRVQLPEESEVLAFLLGQLRASSPMGDAAGVVWENAGTVRVARREPVLTARGKFQSLHVARG